MAYSFVTADEFLLRYDPYRVAQLVTQQGAAQPAQNTLVTNNTLLQMLTDASGWIVMSCAVGARYSRAELVTLADQAEEGAMLRRLTSDLAFLLLNGYRGQKSTEAEQLAPMAGTALKMIDLLEKGQRIFEIDGVAEAGSDIDVLTPDMFKQLAMRGRLSQSRMFPLTGFSGGSPFGLGPNPFGPFGPT